MNEPAAETVIQLKPERRTFEVKAITGLFPRIEWRDAAGHARGRQPVDESRIGKAFSAWYDPDEEPEITVVAFVGMEVEEIESLPRVVINIDEKLEQIYELSAAQKDHLAGRVFVQLFNDGFYDEVAAICERLEMGRIHPAILAVVAAGTYSCRAMQKKNGREFAEKARDYLIQTHGQADADEWLRTASEGNFPPPVSPDIHAPAELPAAQR